MPYSDLTKREEKKRERYRRSREKLGFTVRPYKQRTKEPLEVRQAKETKRVSEYMKRRGRANKIKLRDLKKSRACIRCGFNAHYAALEFHHRDPATKRGNMAKFYYKKSWEWILTEIAKCDLLCANCHRIEHAADFEEREH